MKPFAHAGLVALLLTPSASGQEERTIDLAGPGAPASVTIPDGEQVHIRLLNAVPQRRYRVSIELLGRSPSDVVMIRERSDWGVARYEPAPACASLKEEALALLGIDDEGEVGKRLPILLAALESAPCKPFDKTAIGGQLNRDSRPALNSTFRLAPGEKAVVTVERLAVDTGSPTRKWVATYLGAAPDVGWAFPDEETWLVHGVSQDLLEMAAFAKGRSVTSIVASVKAEEGAAGSPRQFRVTAGTVSQVVRLVPHAWAPQAYTPLARALLEGERPKAASSQSSGILDRLTNLSALVIEAENQRVSRLLTATPLDAELHDQAALVIGVLAFRESARDFSDTRGLLSRMAAHLAMAAALRGGRAPGREAKVADILLSTLVGRQVEALDLLAPMKAGTKTTSAEPAWITALSMRNDGDWRRLENPRKATLLERLECFRALTLADSADHALEMFPVETQEPVPDWGRNALAVRFSVDTGHTFATGAVPMELQELKQVWEVSHSTGLPWQELGIDKVLDAKAGRAVHPEPKGKASIQVLDWGAWSAAGARHVYSHVVRGEHFLRDLWAVPEQADAFRKQADAILGSLPLYAFVTSWLADGPTASGFCPAARDSVQKAPENLSPENWYMAHRLCRESGVPSYASWFSPIVPTGTAVQVSQRLLVPDIALRVSVSQIEAIRRLAPFEANVLLAYLGRKYQGKADAAAIVGEFGRLAEYHERGLRAILEAYEQQPARYRALLEKICEFSADLCPELGSYLVSVDAPEAAALAYLRAVEQGRNRVAVANQVEWLVNYLHDNGRAARALEIAEMAAEAYSHRGLRTMAFYQERLGHYDEAESYFQKIAERYDDDSDLLGFYVRYAKRVGGERFKAEAAKALKKLFPEGLQNVALEDLRGPLAGAMILTPGKAGEAWGLRPRDIVVGLDGYRVETEDQYGCVKRFSDDPKMRLLVWQSGAYREVVGERRHIIDFDPESRDTSDPNRVVSPKN